MRHFLRRAKTSARRLLTPPVRLDLVDRANEYYARSYRGRRITVREMPSVGAGSRVFTIGSCFAREVRAALSRMGVETVPDYQSILNATHVNHYNTFSIREEVHRALSGGRGEYFLRSKTKPGRLQGIYGPEIWQDPLRRYVFASTEDEIVSLSAKLDEAIRFAVETADAYVITLGLTEVWGDGQGHWFNQSPEGPKAEYVLEQTTFSQNYENVAAICDGLQKPIILTVSPVPLKRTFSDDDVVVANTESKSILRAVAGQIAREFAHVTYWPSFEIAQATDMFEADGRNVTRRGVSKIISAFMAASGERTARRA